MKSLYGKVNLYKDDLLDSNIDYMELIYYKIKENTNNLGEYNYGLEVVKNEYSSNDKKQESCTINNISPNEDIANLVINAMMNYKVTPCTLKEDVVEYLKISKE